MAGKRLLVTGGSGFIGTNVINIALGFGYEITNLDFRPPRLGEHRRFWQDIDVRHGNAVLQAVKAFNPHRIMHLASDIDVNLKTLEEYTTIIDGTRNLIAAAKAAPVLERFVYISTQYTVTPGVVPKSETDLQPYTLYGVAKAKAEEQMQVCDLKSWLIVRPTTIWGPFHPSFATQIWRHIAKGTYRHPASVTPIMRSYGYVRNTADQMVKLMDADGTTLDRKVYYLGDGVIDYDVWADAFAMRLTGKPAKRVPIWLLRSLGLAGSAMNAVGLRVPYNVGRYFRMTTSAPTDMESTFAVTGRPKVSFEQGVEESVAWLRDCEHFKDFQTPG
jgi:nucleoside-diphosphate-sugar epimerase